MAYSGLCFLYGFYYTLKPLLIFISRPLLFQAIKFNFVAEEEELIFQEDDATLQIQFKAFKSIRCRGNYYLLKLPEKATIYLRADQLEEGEKYFLNKHLTD